MEKALSDGVDASDAYAPVRALRRLKHERLQQRLFRLDKDARLRSGARGMAARKALVAFEKVVAESTAVYATPPPLFCFVGCSLSGLSVCTVSISRTRR